MNRPVPALLKPRKSPRQARSAATIEAIYAATIQVLLAEGAVRLTTTRVAERAGVSVGTLYQYYPHKQALLFAVVERQLESITSIMERSVERLRGGDLATIAEGIAIAWLDAKFADSVASRAIYGIAAEFDLGGVMGEAAKRMVGGISGLLACTPEVDFDDLHSTAFMLALVLGGSVRVVMEIDTPEEDLVRLRRELPRVCQAYLAAVARPIPHAANVATGDGPRKAIEI